LLAIQHNLGMTTFLDYRGYRFAPEIIAQAVWLYNRFTLSLRDVEDLLTKHAATVP
jgi:putative transposase